MFWFFLGMAVIAVIVMVMRMYEFIWNQRLLKKQVSLRLKEQSFKQGFVQTVGLPLVTGAASIVFAILLYGGSSLSPQFDVQSIQNKTQLLSIIQNNSDNLNGYNRWFGAEVEATADVDFDEDVTALKSSDDYSETNVQVQGVDEADTAKTDGTYIYSISRNRIVITRVFDPNEEEFIVDLVEEKIIEYPNYGDDPEDEHHYEQVFQFYVDDDYLVVLAYEYGFNEDQYYSYHGTMIDTTEDIEPGWWFYGHIGTKVYVYDKDDSFNELYNYTFEGNFIGTRKINDDLFIITNEYIYKEAIEAKESDDVIPAYYKNGNKVDADYEDLTYVENTAPESFVNIFGLSLDTDEVSQTTILGGGYNLYVSTQNIYLTQTKYNQTLSFFDGEELIDYKETTSILKVSLDQHNTAFTAMGEVEGSVLNQFSLGEYQGNLRIATTIGNWWSNEEIDNRLYILDEQLNELSKVVGLGEEGERIQSVRYSGQWAYIVTFRVTDPIYIIDTSNPSNPIVRSELKISGFSTYLHPFGEDYLLGIGFEADSEGRRIGLKIAMFDVSDKDNIQELGTDVLLYEEHFNGGWAWTSATYNHKDLLIDVDKGIIGFPLEFSGFNQADGRYEYSQGYTLYDINVQETGENVFDFNGYIKHTFDQPELPEDKTDGEVYDSFYYYYNWHNRIYKGMFIEDNLFTISENGIVVSPLDDISTDTNTIQFN